MRFFIFLLFLASCGKSLPIVETPGGGVYVKKILTTKNLITCKKVAYCIYEKDWEECTKNSKPKQVFKEYACIDLANDDSFNLSLEDWDKEKHKFGEFYLPHVFDLLDQLKYVKENTEIFDREIPEMEEDFRVFHEGK